jgi:hypothetical protein
MGRGKSPKTVALIEAAFSILEEIQPASVRAVCYRLFTLGLIKNMDKAETNKVSTQLTWATERLRGFVNTHDPIRHVFHSFRD